MANNPIGFNVGNSSTKNKNEEALAFLGVLEKTIAMKEKVQHMNIPSSSKKQINKKLDSFLNELS